MYKAFVEEGLSDETYDYNKRKPNSDDISEACLNKNGGGKTIIVVCKRTLWDLG